MKPKCNQCKWKKKYESAPTSWIGRIWKWHTRYCPGWKEYLESLSSEEKTTLLQRYQLNPKKRIH
jgi:hypothetical protein